MTEPSVDVMGTIARDLRALPKETQQAVRPELRRVGRMVAREAAVKASWSTRIPATIKVVTSFQTNREGVTIRAGGKTAPHARPYEGITSGSTFRRPVYGNYKVWVTTATRPFLLPAAESTKGTVDQAMGVVMDKAARGIGFN